jgi:putative DNA primase/helicase
MFFSIGVQLNQRADYSRFSMLGLKAFEGYQTDSEFATFIDKWNSIVSDDVVKQLQTRTMRLLPKIIKNSKTFSDAVSAEIGNRRIGDQVGGMLAGAYSLGNEDEISMEKAIEFIKKLSWEEEKGLEQTKDEIQLLSKIMSHITTVEGQYSKHDRTIGELVSLVIGTDIESDISVDHADKKLRRIGIRIKGDEILISNSSNEIFKIIKETSWSENYNKILQRIEGAGKVDFVTFTPGLRGRAVSIPAEFIMKGMNS